MSKRTTTRWYIGAWLVWLIAFVVTLSMLRGNQGGGPTTGPTILYLIVAAAGIVTLVAWIGALVKLGTQRAWGWFVGVLILHLIGLGIVGMVAYAVAGPPDEIDVAVRPSTT